MKDGMKKGRKRNALQKTAAQQTAVRGRSLRRIAFLLSVSLLAGTASSPVTSMADNDKEKIEQSIQEKQNAIGEAQKQKSALQSGLTDVKKLVAELESSKKNLKDYVTKLDANLAEIEKKIAELKALIDEKEKEIDQTQEALEEAIAVEEEQYAAMKQRIKFMYENGQTFYLDMIFAAENFGDMLNRTEFVEKLAAYDRRKLEEYRETRAQIEELKEELEAEKIVLDAAKETVEEEQASVNALIASKEQEIKAYDSDIGNKSQLIQEYEAEIAAQNAAIAALEQAVAEEKKKLEEANRPKYDGGKFKWPAPSYTRISDDYGNRIHPTLGVQQFHNGIDMAAPSGSPILAAYDGEVVAAAYNASMGNYVMIDHGDSVYTIYMHASALYVSKGQQVSRGDKIAAVGSTGRSTGPHLHFSVRVNGSYVSPWNYLSS